MRRKVDLLIREEARNHERTDGVLLQLSGVRLETEEEVRSS